MESVLSMPLSHLAILYRCNAHGTGMCKSGTFQEDDIAAEAQKLLEKMNNGD